MLPPLFLRRGGMSCVSSARESEGESASWISEDEFEVGEFLRADDLTSETL